LPLLLLPVLDLAWAPRRTARKKGSGYENEYFPINYFVPILREFARHSIFKRSGELTFCWKYE
jgi:hypothetical protein